VLFAPVIHPQMHEWIGGNGASVESAGNGSSLLPSSRAIAEFKYRRGDDETGYCLPPWDLSTVKELHAAARRVWRRLHAIDFESSNLISVNDSRLGVLTALHRMSVCMK
jgi:hypothetical protein